MSVHQVEEYYIHLNFGGTLSSGAHDEIEAILANEGYSDFEFQDDDSVLVVDGIPSEHDGDILESLIQGVVGG